MNKLYFNKEDKPCFSLKYWKEYLKENNLNSLELTEAKRSYGTGFFFCKEFQRVGEVNESCGSLCSKYAPNNGVNGRCRHYGYVYEETDKKITITIGMVMREENKKQ